MGFSFYLSFAVSLFTLNASAEVCRCVAPPRESHLFEDLKLNCPELSNSAAVMACMPGAMRANYVLMYETGSPQCASPENPRLVLFSADGKSMVSFPGKHGAPGCDSASVEFVSFNTKQSSYSPGKLVFDADGKAHFHSPPSEVTGKCTQCHDKDFHPNWTSYPTWPGAYGANHSRILPGSAEAKAYTAFARTAPKDALYSQLKPVPSLKEPYSMTKVVPGGERNAKLNLVIMRRNTERLVRKLKSSEAYKRQKYRLLAGVLSEINPSLKSCQPFDAAEMDEFRIAVSEDFRAERALMKKQMPDQGSDPSWRLPVPEGYPSRDEIAANPAKLDAIRKDRGIGTVSLVMMMARKLGIVDTDDFFNRPNSTRYEGGKKLFSVDRTIDFDQRLGGLLAKALIQDIARDEAEQVGHQANNPFPLSSYIDANQAGVEDDVCKAYNPDLKLSMAEARKNYGEEECRNGIREYPLATTSSAPAPDICERLRRSDQLEGTCLDNAEPTLKPGPQTDLNAIRIATRNSGNLLISCAGCHDGTHPPIPKIPFADPRLLKQELTAAGSTLSKRIMDQVNAGSMPPGGGFKNPADKTAIEKYLRELTQ